jgi:hypothetical protein
MRTKLDEIVDHFIKTYKSGDPDFRNCLVESHEQAFRHGAEQHTAYGFNPFGYEGVQPAPAEEKHVPCDGHLKCERCGLRHVSPFKHLAAPTTDGKPWPTKDGRHAAWCINDAHLFGRRPVVVPTTGPPVEEKPSACDCGWCEGTSEEPCEVARLAPSVFDRRKGERRKGSESHNWVHGTTVPFEQSRLIYQTNDHGSFWYDRRSDKDRRKP